jgi:hypothetical protein
MINRAWDHTLLTMVRRKGGHHESVDAFVRNDVGACICGWSLLVESGV